MRAIYYLLPVVLMMTSAKAAEPYRRKQPSDQPRTVVPWERPMLAPPTTVPGDRYFHIEDFSGLGGGPLTPLQGLQSVWCGRYPDPLLCYVKPGYGHNWRQQFESVQIPVIGSHGRVDFLARWDVETSYDYVYLQARSSTQDWTTTSTLTGEGSGLLSISVSTSVPPDDWVQFRIVLTSDDIYDAEDGYWPQYQAGAAGIMIDSLTVRDGLGNVVEYQSFESENVGDLQTIDGHWVADPVYVVTSEEDSGPGTLRDGITVTNASSSLNRIVFHVGAGDIKIKPKSPLPHITDYLIIDGFTQPGASPNTKAVGVPSDANLQVELDGLLAGLGATGLRFQAPGKVRGLALSHWGTAIIVGANNVTIEGNHIGSDVAAQQDDFSFEGIRLVGNEFWVGGCSPAARNVISGHSYVGIEVDVSATYGWIQGNYMGVGVDAVTPLGNASGIRVAGNAQRVFIGSASPMFPQLFDPREANILAHNDFMGVDVPATTVTRTTIVGNVFHDNGNRAIYIWNGGAPAASYVSLQNPTGPVIQGEVFGPANTSAIVHFYRSAACGGPWENGNAEVYVGAVGKSTAANGFGSFSFTPTQPLPPACWITATATFNQGFTTLNTSELSVCSQYQNTPLGPGPVDLLDGNLNVRGIVTFEEVASPGNTFLEWPYLPSPPISGGFYIGDPGDPNNYFNITSTATYTIPVSVCLFYNENNIPGPEADLVLVHYNGSMWEDVTLYVDTVNNMVCGEVNSLSPFAIAVPVPTGVGDAPTPASFALRGNVPNPFNPITTISYDIPAGGSNVNISIYDVAGRMVRELVNQHRAPGTWSVQWNGDDDRGQRVASGVYFYRMRAGQFVETRKMVLLK